MHAIILAGGKLKTGDPLYDENPNQPKALIEVAGKPMVQWVIEALDGAQLTEDIVVVGLDGIAGIQARNKLYFLPDHGSLLENVEASLSFINKMYPEVAHALVASADVPAITPKIVDWRIESLDDTTLDIDYAIVTKGIMETRFPDAHRSYVKLRDIEVCGGDLNILRVGLAQDTDFWEKAVAARKSPFQQARLIGFRFLILVLLRRLRLIDAQEYIVERLGLAGRATISPFAEVAMDVDKPDQLAILREDLANRSQ